MRKKVDNVSERASKDEREAQYDDDVHFSNLYAYAQIEAKLLFMSYHETEYEQCHFAMEEMALYQKHWDLQVVLCNGEEQEKFAANSVMKEIQNQSIFDPGRYWAYVNGKQALCYADLLENAGIEDPGTCAPEVLVSLFKEAFTLTEGFPYPPFYNKLVENWSGPPEINKV